MKIVGDGATSVVVEALDKKNENKPYAIKKLKLLFEHS